MNIPINPTDRQYNFIDATLLQQSNIPKPLHGLTPREIKGQAWWDRVRHTAYAKNDNCCWACGTHRDDALYHHWLEAHEIYSIDYVAGEAQLTGVAALCHACHNFIHSGRMVMVVGKLYSETKVLEIINRGLHLLDTAKLPVHMHTLYAMNRLKNLYDPTVIKTWNIEKRLTTAIGTTSSKMAEWSKWHLLLDGQIYYSIFESEAEWRKFYDNANHSQRQ